MVVVVEGAGGMSSKKTTLNRSQPPLQHAVQQVRLLETTSGCHTMHSAWSCRNGREQQQRLGCVRMPHALAPCVSAGLKHVQGLPDLGVAAASPLLGEGEQGLSG